MAICVVILVAVLMCVACGRDDEGDARSTVNEAASREVANATEFDEVLQAMRSLLAQRPTGTDAASMRAQIENMEKILALGTEVEKKWPDAPALSQAHRLMLQAADFLANARRDEASRTQLDDLVTRVLASNADVETKVTADFARLKHGAQTNGQPAADADEQIEAFVNRYKNTPGAGNAYAFGASLAEKLGLTDLRALYMAVLKAKSPDNPAVLNYLRAIGEYSDVGKPFTATLTRLDGTTLTLPDDLKGNVVVVLFWASRNGPSVEAMPAMKEFYQAYKDKGVEIVGISLDKTSADTTAFVQQNGLDWIHTHDGGDNATAIRYGLKDLPTAFVVGPDGLIVSVNALATLRDTVDKMLK